MANVKYDPMLCMNVPVKGTKAQDAKARDEDLITLEDLLPDDYSGNEALRILRRFGFKNVRIDGEYMIATGNKKAWEKAWQNGWFENAIMGNKSKIEKMQDAARRTTDYRVEVEENLKSLIRNYEQGNVGEGGEDYVYMLFENSKYSPHDEKQWERCKNDAIKDMQDLAKDLKSAATQIVDRGTQKMVNAIRKMRYDD